MSVSTFGFRRTLRGNSSQTVAPAPIHLYSVALGAEGARAGHVGIAPYLPIPLPEYCEADWCATTALISVVLLPPLLATASTRRWTGSRLARGRATAVPDTAAHRFASLRFASVPFLRLGRTCGLMFDAADTEGSYTKRWRDEASQQSLTSPEAARCRSNRSGSRERSPSNLSLVRLLLPSTNA